MDERRGKLPGGSEMTAEVLTPPEGHSGDMGARGPIAHGSVVIYHGRVEQPYDNDGPPMGNMRPGPIQPLPKDA